MVNEEILGGLRSAVDRGERLVDAMNSFLNAGYDRQEIKEASEVFKEEEGPKPAPKKQAKKAPKKITRKKKPKKRVSEYSGKKKPSAPKWIIISIIIVALILVGVTIAYFVST